MAVHKTLPTFEAGGGLSSSTIERNPSDPSFPLRRENSGTFGSGGLDANDAISRWSKNSGNQRRIILDYSRQHVTGETMELLFDLADRMGLTERMNEMRCGMNINYTQRQAVMHHVLRMPKEYDFKARHPQGDTILNDVHSVLDRIARFSDDVREGRIRGCTGKELKNIVCVSLSLMTYICSLIY